MKRPETDEFNPYYGKYISLVEGDDVLSVLGKQVAQMREMFTDVPEEKGTFAYADGKWTTKEVLSHLIDGERIFSYRVLRISRGDETPIEGFEQDGYIENSNANNRCFAEVSCISADEKFFGAHCRIIGAKERSLRYIRSYVQHSE